MWRFIMVAVIAVVVWGCDRPGQRAPRAMEAVRSEPFSILVEGRSELRSAKETYVQVPISPPLLRMGRMKLVELVEEGIQVEKGQMVASLDTAELEQFILRYEGEVKIATSSLEGVEKTLHIERNRLEEEVKKADVSVQQKEVELNLARLYPTVKEKLAAELALEEAILAAKHQKEEWESAQYLASKQLISDFNFAQKKLEYLNAQALVKEKETALAILRQGSEPLRIAKLETALYKERISLNQVTHNLKYKVVGLKAELTKAQRRLYRPTRLLESAREFREKCKLVSSIPGIVLYQRIWTSGGREKVKKGMSIWGGYNFLAIQDTSEIKAVVEIPESQISFIQKGQKATVHIDSLEEKEFTGEVVEIGTVAHDKDEEFGQQEGERDTANEKVFSVKVQLAKQDRRLKPGLRCTVRIIVREIANATTIPESCLWKEAGKTLVYVWERGNVVVRDVVLGPAFANRVVVEKGVQPGELVLLEEPHDKAQPQPSLTLAMDDQHESSWEITPAGMVSQGLLIHKSIETGILYPQNAIPVETGIRGELTEIVPDGSDVKQGDKIFVITAKQNQNLEEAILQKQTQEAALEKQQSELELAQKNQDLEVQKAQFDIDLAQTELTLLQKKPLPLEVQDAQSATERARLARELASISFKIAQELWAKQLISEAELSQARLKLETSKVRWEIAQLKEKILLRGALPEEIQLAQQKLSLEKVKFTQVQKAAASVIEQYQMSLRVAEARLAEAEYSLTVDQEAMSNGISYAPVSGVLRYVDGWGGKAEIGKEYYEEEPLVIIADEAQMVVKTKVSEVDRAGIAVGQAVKIWVPAFPDRTFSGKVVSVGQLAVDRNEIYKSKKPSGITAFEVKVAIADSYSGLKTGMSATVDIILEEFPDLLKVPKLAIAEGKDGHYVFLLRSGKAEKVPVRLGIANEWEVAVSGNLKAGEKVCLIRKKKGQLAVSPES